jgi:hypothetical protein
MQNIELQQTTSEEIASDLISAILVRQTQKEDKGVKPWEM